MVIAFSWGKKTTKLKYLKICYICRNLYRQEIVYTFNILILQVFGIPCS